jgi:hypothetical protein
MDLYEVGQQQETKFRKAMKIETDIRKVKIVYSSFKLFNATLRGVR